MGRGKDNNRSGGKSFAFSNNNQDRQKRDDDTQDRIQLNQNVQQQRQPQRQSQQRGNLTRVSPGQKKQANKNQSSRVITPTPDRQPKKTLAKTVQKAQKSYKQTVADAKSKGVNKPGNAPKPNQGARAELPNLDDIDNEFNPRDNGRGRRRFVDYEEQYATTGVKNKLKDKYKRGKASKKGSSVFGTLESQSGNSVLDSYRSLGKRLGR